MDACESFADLAIHSLTQGFPSQYRKQSLYEPLKPGTHIRAGSISYCYAAPLPRRDMR